MTTESRLSCLVRDWNPAEYSLSACHHKLGSDVIIRVWRSQTSTHKGGLTQDKGKKTENFIKTNDHGRSCSIKQATTQSQYAVFVRPIAKRNKPKRNALEQQSKLNVKRSQVLRVSKESPLLLSYKNNNQKPQQLNSPYRVPAVEVPTAEFRKYVIAIIDNGNSTNQ